MKKQRKKEKAAAGEDLISNLPDDILHCILRRIPWSTEVAQTSALSRRWGNLWRSYPVVQFHYHWFLSKPEKIKSFQNFSEATIERFSGDKQLRMEALQISLNSDNDNLLSLAVGGGFPAVEQLLDLASKRNAEFVTIAITQKYVVCLPLGLLTSSSAKTLHFEGIRFVLNKNIHDDPLLCLNSLRSLILDHVELDGGERLLTNLIASSPLLQTLKLLFVKGIRKLCIMSNVANLKSLEIYYDNHLVEIKIAASALQTMCIRSSLYPADDHVLELIAPQLNSLDIECCDISRLGMISSNLQFLKSLNLCQPFGDLPLLPRSLRCLCLNDLELTEEQVLLNLIAGSPSLETLQLVKIKKLRKLQVVNLRNLKTLDIISCGSVKEIEIVAFELQSLRIVGWDYWMMEEMEDDLVMQDYEMMVLSKIELIAPQLNALEMIYSGLEVDELQRVVSKLLSLKSLSLAVFDQTEKKLKLSGRRLEEITLSVLGGGLEEIELDVVPRLKKFVLRYDDWPADPIKKCEVKNSAASCRWEVDFHMKLTHDVSDADGLSWFVDFKNFIARFPNFHTVNVSFAPEKEVNTIQFITSISFLY
ncbi:F-box/LRR-repeat protein 25 [Linum grandiflorum]